MNCIRKIKVKEFSLSTYPLFVTILFHSQEASSANRQIDIHFSRTISQISQNKRTWRKTERKIVVQNCPSGANTSWREGVDRRRFQSEGTWSKSRIRVQDKGERRLSRGEGEVLEFSACGVVSSGCKTTCKTCARDAFCQLRFWPYLHGKSIEESVKNTTNRATNSNYDTKPRVNYVQTKKICMNYPRLEGNFG